MSNSLKKEYTEDWLSSLYNEFPPPLPLRRVCTPKEEEQVSPEPVNSSFRSKTLIEAPKPPEGKRRKFRHKSHSISYDGLFSELLSPRKPSNEVMTFYCSCKLLSESFKHTRRALKCDTVEIPLSYKEDYIELPNLVYVKQPQTSYKELVQSLCDPNLPCYNKGDLVSSVVCGVHRKIHQRRSLVRRASLSLCDLIFDSEFESGNLDKVSMVSNSEFNLYLTVDTNTRGHNQWFYFAVKNISAHKVVTFNILNLTKPGSLYTKGMRPFVYSEKQCSEFGLGWHRAGFEIKYFKNNRTRVVKGKTSHYFTLKFSYKFPVQNDTVYFAYSEPYTYSQLISTLESLKVQGKDFEFSETALCRSLGGLHVPLIRISSREQRNAPLVGITARVHPGETVGSLMCEGLLRFLTSDEGTTVRKCCDFLVIPMLNPDGVVCGNYRTSLAGADLNRRWVNPDGILFPTIKATKEAFRGINCFIDLHGHSKNEACFMYGNYHSRRDPKYWKVRLLPMLLDSLSPNFDYTFCKFMQPSFHPTTARAVVFRDMDITQSFTLEASSFGFTTRNACKEFIRRDYLEVGEKLGMAISGLMMPQQITSQEDLNAFVGNFNKKLHKKPKVIKKFVRRISKPPEKATEDSNTSGSDSNPSDDNLEPEELQDIYSVVVEKYNLQHGTNQFAVVKKLDIERVSVKSVFRDSRGFNFRAKERNWTLKKSSPQYRPVKLSSLTKIKH